MSDIWKADQYSRYLDERTQPAIDLLARITDCDPALAVDLGCGTGNSTSLLHKRWPKATIIGLDKSKNMLEEARKDHPSIKWEDGDIANWQPSTPPDVIFANASLQWLPDHKHLLPKLWNCLHSKGTLAIQMPRNFNAPSHQVLLQVVAEGSWREQLLPLLQYGKDYSPVGTPEFYYQLLAPYTSYLAIWQTDYLTVMSGENPVVEWMKGTSLRPLLAVLNENERQQFLSEYSERLQSYYPKQKNGRTLFSFKRLFIVATKEK